ncbi:MAG: aspartate--tRNA(Asn) ligase [Cyanobacteria bacterium SZAS TMP-1]|nr:aspartate--tRNA(Asn) ligase [Cyanobacteria bacterium SZAS TMP-1]
MMETIALSQAAQYVSQVVRIKGHLQGMRDLGQIMFLNVRDREASIQVVVENPELLAKARALALETPCFFEGTMQTRLGKAQAAAAQELVLTAIEPLSPVSETCPVEIGKQSKIDGLSPQTLLDYRPLTLRNEKVRAIFKIEAEIVKAFRQYLDEQCFTEIHSSKLVSTGTEGGAQLFAVDYFGRQAYLAQSPQFYKQIMVGAFERVYEVGPVYRAEEHDTTRHLNEYISLDFEMGFIQSEQDVIRMQIGLLRHIFSEVSERCAKEFALYGITLPKIETIAQITLEEARSLLTEKYRWQPEPTVQDLDGEGERLLCAHFEKNEGLSMVYVTNYPHKIRPFYAMPASQENGSAGAASAVLGSKSFDLLYGGLEITTGGQRIHEYAKLTQSMQSRGLNPEDFGDYLMAFKHGLPPHGGLAIGLERLAKQMLKLPSVKQTALFPRDINRLTP